MCQCAREQGSRAGLTYALRHHTWHSHLLGLLILHSSPWQGNEPHRVAGSPHVTTMMGAYRGPCKTVLSGIRDSSILITVLVLFPIGGLTAPQELRQLPWAPDKQNCSPVRGSWSGNPDILTASKREADGQPPDPTGP